MIPPFLTNHVKDREIWASRNYQGLWKEWGAHCNFFDTGKMDVLYPTLSDLRMLRLSTVIVSLFVLGLLGASGYALYSYLSAMGHPSLGIDSPANQAD